MLNASVMPDKTWPVCVDGSHQLLPENVTHECTISVVLPEGYNKN